MLARLQKFIALGLLGLALVWALLFLRAGHVTWAVVGSGLVVFGHALVLALEFIALRAVHGDDPAPRATPAQLLRAWWGEVGSAPLVFFWRQPFRSRRWPDHTPTHAMGRRGVLLVHGFVCNRGIWNPWLQRLHARDVACIAVNLEPVFGSIDDYMSSIDAAVGRLESTTGMSPLIVAHSMGGLAVRAWWSRPGNLNRVHRVITIGTPHAGTWLARLAVTPNGMQMRRNSPWLRAVSSREPEGHSTRFTCFYGHCDNIVFPPSTATLAGADNRHIPAVAHVHMANRPEPWEEALRWLS